MSDIEYNLLDAIIERPHDFSVGRKSFRFYPVTLAKMILLKRQIDGLCLDMAILKTNPYLEAIRVVKENRDVCCHILAYHTAPNSYKDLFDNRAVSIRKNFFSKELDDEDLASLMIYVLTSDKTEAFIKHVGLDKERERLSKIMQIKRKHDKNNLSFGGLTILGTFVGQLKENGYSDNEILYEKGYTYLKLMLADKVTTIYLSDEEMQDIPVSMGGTLLDGNDPASIEKLNTYLSSRGVNTI